MFPEFALFKHRVPLLTPAQQHKLIIRMALNSVRVGECICWMGHCNNDGYPKTNFRIRSGDASLYVHQLPLSMKTGRDRPEGKDTSHACDTAACINPEHLSYEKSKDNYRRSAENTNRKKARELKRRRREHDEERIAA